MVLEENIKCYRRTELGVTKGNVRGGFIKCIIVVSCGNFVANDGESKNNMEA